MSVDNTAAAAAEQISMASDDGRRQKQAVSALLVVPLHNADTSCQQWDGHMQLTWSFVPKRKSLSRYTLDLHSLTHCNISLDYNSNGKQRERKTIK